MKPFANRIIFFSFRGFKIWAAKFVFYDFDFRVKKGMNMSRLYLLPDWRFLFWRQMKMKCSAFTWSRFCFPNLALRINDYIIKAKRANRYEKRNIFFGQKKGIIFGLYILMAKQHDFNNIEALICGSELTLLFDLI